MKQMNRLPFLGAWELDKSVMLLVGSVMIAVTTTMSGIAFMSLKDIAWRFSDLSSLSLFVAVLSLVLFWTMAHRIDYIQNLTESAAGKILCGALAALLVICGALEFLSNRQIGMVNEFDLMKYVSFSMLALCAFGWAVANRSKSAGEIQNAISCVVLGMLFYTASRMLESIAVINLNFAVFCKITAVNLQCIGLVLAFTGLVIYERYLYTVKQYILSRRFLDDGDDSDKSTLEWAMSNIGTPINIDKHAESSSAAEVEVTKR